jgi:serine O-acetyltransferase
MSVLLGWVEGASELAAELMSQWRTDVDTLPTAFLARDPAARSRWEVLALYPGVRAVLAHRAAHALWKRGSFFWGRALSEVSRSVTGIEIHPGAQLGAGVTIDHGQGVVIGETAVVEDDVLIYQGVTLGGTGKSLSDKGKSNHTLRRHPHVESGAVLGVGAKILGSIKVGKGAKVGAGAVVVQDVDPGTTVVGIPARPVEQHRPTKMRGSRVKSSE